MKVNSRQALHKKLTQELAAFSTKHSLKGAHNSKILSVLVDQLIDSIRRVEYVYLISSRQMSAAQADPSLPQFDPLKAAIFHRDNGNYNEAFWLTFLAIHFGKHLKTKWLRVQDVYGALGDKSKIWTWDKVSNSPQDFNHWIISNYKSIRGGFGNHRKYESMQPTAPRSPVRVVNSYLDWVGPTKCHTSILNPSINNDPRKQFEYLYRSMNKVASFGRTAKFDYLTMLGKLDLLEIEPGRTFMQGSTGPGDGARLLFERNINAAISNRALESILIEMEKDLSLGDMGMQVLEDAICNWQKSPSRYRLFRG